MATIQPQRSPSFDARGRALPLSPEEIRLRAIDAIRALDEVAEMGDEAEQRSTFEALKQAIDEDRLSDRARFAE